MTDSEIPSADDAHAQAPESEPESESLAKDSAAPPPEFEERVRWGRAIPAMGLIILAALGMFGILIATKKTPPRSDAKASLTGVKVILAQTREVQAEVIGLGRVRPRRRVIVSAQVGGLALRVHPDLRDGTYLEGGTLVVQIDKADHEAELRRAVAMADSARAEESRLLAQAAFITSRIVLARELTGLEVANLERTRDLLTKTVGTDRDVDTARLAVLRSKDTLLGLQTTQALLTPQLSAARAKISEAEAARSTAALKRDRATIRMPFSGVVAKVAVEEHQLLSPGQALFEVWQVNTVEVPVALSLADATLLARDLDLRRKGEPDEAITARVEQENGGELESWTALLRRFEPVDGATQTVKAVVEVSNTADRAPLFPGVFVRVSLTAVQKQRGLAIPVSALQERNQVYAVREGKLEILRPTLGKQLGRWVFVVAGIEEDEQIVISPLEKVVEGISLEVVEVVKAPAATGSDQ